MNEAKIRSTLERVLKERGYEPEKRRKEIIFHLTDWLTELQGWSEFCESPDSLSSKEVEKLVTGFLLHVPNHVAAASKLMLDTPVSDIFEVGAIESDE